MVQNGMRGEDAWRGDKRRGVGLYVNMWDMEKGWLASQVFGLDSHPFIGNRIGAIVGTPRMYLVAMFALGL